VDQGIYDLVIMDDAAFAGTEINDMVTSIISEVNVAHNINIHLAIPFMTDKAEKDFFELLNDIDNMHGYSYKQEKIKTVFEEILAAIEKDQSLFKFYEQMERLYPEYNFDDLSAFYFQHKIAKTEVAMSIFNPVFTGEVRDEDGNIVDHKPFIPVIEAMEPYKEGYLDKHRDLFGVGTAKETSLSMLHAGVLTDLLKLVSGITLPINKILIEFNKISYKDLSSDEVSQILKDLAQGNITVLKEHWLPFYPVFDALLQIILVDRSISIHQFAKENPELESIRVEFINTFKKYGVDNIKVKIFDGNELIEDNEEFILSPLIKKDNHMEFHTSKLLLEALYEEKTWKRKELIENIVIREIFIQDYLKDGLSFDEAHEEILRVKGQKELFDWAKEIVALHLNISSVTDIPTDNNDLPPSPAAKIEDLLKLVGGITLPLNKIVTEFNKISYKDLSKEEVSQILEELSHGNIALLKEHWLPFYSVFDSLLKIFLVDRNISFDQIAEKRLELESIREELLYEFKKNGIENLRIKIFDGTELIGGDDAFILSKLIEKERYTEFNVSKLLLEALYKEKAWKRKTLMENIVLRELSMQVYLEEGLSFDEAHEEILRVYGQKELFDWSKEIVALYLSNSVVSPMYTYRIGSDIKHEDLEPVKRLLIDPEYDFSNIANGMDGVLCNLSNENEKFVREGDSKWVQLLNDAFNDIESLAQNNDGLRDRLSNIVRKNKQLELLVTYDLPVNAARYNNVIYFNASFVREILEEYYKFKGNKEAIRWILAERLLNVFDIPENSEAAVIKNDLETYREIVLGNQELTNTIYNYFSDSRPAYASGRYFELLNRLSVMNDINIVEQEIEKYIVSMHASGFTPSDDTSLIMVHIGDDYEYSFRAIERQMYSLNANDMFANKYELSLNKIDSRFKNLKKTQIVEQKNAPRLYFIENLTGKRFILVGGGLGFCHLREFKGLLNQLRQAFKEGKKVEDIEIHLPLDSIYNGVKHASMIDTELAEYITALDKSGFNYEIQENGEKIAAFEKNREMPTIKYNIWSNTDDMLEKLRTEEDYTEIAAESTEDASVEEQSIVEPVIDKYELDSISAYSIDEKHQIPIIQSFHNLFALMKNLFRSNDKQDDFINDTNTFKFIYEAT
jgi:hypothetical protein